MDIEFDKKDMCPIIGVDGFIESGKQFDLDITLPEDNRNVIYGIVKDYFGEPVKDAVVKLIEVVNDCGKTEKLPVSHSFTDKSGEFVFGPLCPDRFYEVQIWADQVKHHKICTHSKRDKKCLKGKHLECCKKEEKPCKTEKKDTEI